MEPELEELLDEISLYNKFGVLYDQELSKKIFRYFFRKKGKEYKQLVRYTANLILRSPFRNRIGGVHEVINILVAAVLSGKRIWKYNSVPFLIFATKAAKSIIKSIEKKNKAIVWHSLPPDSEDSAACNIVEFAPDPGISVMDCYDANETMDNYRAYLQKEDPVAYNVLKLVCEDMTSEQIAAELNIEIKEVLNARRRYKKAALSFYPSGNDRYTRRRKPRQQKYQKDINP